MLRYLYAIWNEFKSYITTVFLLLVSLYFISIDSSPEVRNIKKAAFSSFAFITYSVTNVLDFIKGDSDYERLRDENARLMLQINRLREYGIENQDLKKLLTIADTVNYHLIPGKVVTKRFSKSQSLFTLDAGEKNGVKIGMPVINSEGLVGIIIETSGHYSIIRTLQNVEFRAAVINQRSRVNGVLYWDGGNLVMRNIPKTADMQMGDRVNTSDFSSILPPSIPVGTVAGGMNSSIGIFNNIVVKPFVNFVKVENVFVIDLVMTKEKDNLEFNLLKK
ncbi:MAG TPA: rod shape-determining protein MreC [Ignavibacteriales bacterium]|nr:rod shape-determining protein MreC [Ignavibacteriales bacterium]